jgi:hypothetical protein
MLNNALPAALRTACLGLALAAAGLAGAQTAAPTTKDIVLMRVSTAQSAGAAEVPPGGAMAVSALLESADGSLSPRGTDTLFRTSDRFRVKLVASLSGTLWLCKATPDGVLQPAPVWQGEVRDGQELIRPRMRLEGRSSVDQLHVLLEPTEPTSPRVHVWLRGWAAIDKAASASAGADKGGKTAQAKGIRLDVQNTHTTTYLLNPVVAA